MKRRCQIDGCPYEATWRQFDPVDPEHPLYLCTQHWNEKRIVEYDRSLNYSPLRLFPEGAADPPA
jgi:hypothetical protein